MIRAVYSPHFDHARTITAYDAPSKRRVDARQRSDDVLMRLEKVLLVMRDQRHSLRRTVGVARQGCRVRPCFDVRRCRTRARADSATEKRFG